MGKLARINAAKKAAADAGQHHHCQHHGPTYRLLSNQEHDDAFFGPAGCAAEMTFLCPCGRVILLDTNDPWAVCRSDPEWDDPNDPAYLPGCGRRYTFFLAVAEPDRQPAPNRAAGRQN